MSISTFFISSVCGSYCFLPILTFYPVEQISVQFIFRSIIEKKFYVANFSYSCTKNSEGLESTSLELKGYIFSLSSSVKLNQQ